MKVDTPSSHEATIQQQDSKAQCCLIASSILFGFTILFGIGSIISTAIAWNDDDDYYYEYYYDDDVLSPASAAAVSIGTLSLIVFIVSVPLACCAGKMYLDNRIVDNKSCVLSLMIVGWVIYGIAIINGFATAGVGASGGDVSTAWVVVSILLFVPAWTLMLSYILSSKKGALRSTNAAVHEGTCNASTSASHEDGIPCYVSSPATITSGTTVSTSTPPLSPAHYEGHNPPVIPSTLDEKDEGESFSDSDEESFEEIVKEFKTKPDGTTVNKELKTITHSDKTKSYVKTIVLSKKQDDGSIKRKTTVIHTDVNGESNKDTKTEVCDV